MKLSERNRERQSALLKLLLMSWSGVSGRPRQLPPAPACSTSMLCPAMTIAALRYAPSLAATVYAMLLAPAPLLFVMVIQLTPVLAVQAQPAAVVTAMLPAPPPGSNESRAGASA